MNTTSISKIMPIVAFFMEKVLHFSRYSNRVRMDFVAKLLRHVSKILSMVLLSFSIAFCGGDPENPGDNPVVPPSCEITGQVYDTDEKSCQCPGEQFLNADSTACVSSCLEGQIKPDNAKTCVTAMVCTGRQVLNPTDNSCMDITCTEGELPDMTVDSPVCITLAACRSGANKVVSTDEDTCITSSACTSTDGQIATATGNCEVCSGGMVRNLSKTMCVACDIASLAPGQANVSGTCTACTGLTDDDGSPKVASLNKTECIDATACTNTFGQANVGGDCTACTSTSKIASVDKTMCIDATVCTSAAGQANILGDCTDCASISQVASVDKTMCIDATTCTSTAGRFVDTNNSSCTNCTGLTGGDAMPQIVGLDGASCIDATVCTDTIGQIIADKECMACGEPTPLTNVDKTACISSSTCTGMAGHFVDNVTLSCFSDMDMDGIADAVDSCANGMTGTASTTNNTAPTADPDMDGCKNSEDVDDDNDGLIEIGTAAELNNMRFDLAGKSYDDEANDDAGNEGDTSGAPTSTTTLCKTETSGGSGIYLCGYELTGNIDLSSEDLNGRTAGNLDPIGEDTSGNHFTASFDGNGHAIINLDIDRITRFRARGSEEHTRDAALFASCRNANITNLILENPKIKGRRYVGSLCGRMRVATMSNVHIKGGLIQGDGKLNLNNIRMGGLVGDFTNSSHIENCSFNGTVSEGGTGADNMGGLVGIANSSTRIIASWSSGNISDGGDGSDQMGGLVGFASNNVRIIASQSSANVFDGGDGNDYLGGLVGWHTASQIIASRSSGNVSDGGKGTNYLGGLVGYTLSKHILVGSRNSGNVSDGGKGDGDSLGGLIGYSRSSIVRDSYSSGAVCDGMLTNSCAAGDGVDNIGILTGRFNRSQIHNCLGTGQVSGSGGDRIGLIGWLDDLRNASGLSTLITNNRFDKETTGTATRVGLFRGEGRITGITGKSTTKTKAARAYNNTWLATRWHFAADSYPQLLYFDYDPDDDSATDNTIDVCETISSNDMTTDEGDANKPDCGDLLNVWPRQMDAVFHLLPTDLELMENADGSTTAIEIGSPVTAYDRNEDAIAYSLKAGAPAGYVIDSTTGQISYTGTGEDYDTNMTRSLTVIATSIGTSGSATQVEQVVTINIGDARD